MARSDRAVLNTRLDKLVPTIGRAERRNAAPVGTKVVLEALKSAFPYLFFCSKHFLKKYKTYYIEVLTIAGTGGIICYILLLSMIPPQ